MYFSVPDEQLTLDGAWMDDSDKENSPEPAGLAWQPLAGATNEQ